VPGGGVERRRTGRRALRRAVGLDVIDGDRAPCPLRGGARCHRPEGPDGSAHVDRALGDADAGAQGAPLAAIIHRSRDPINCDHRGQRRDRGLRPRTWWRQPRRRRRCLARSARPALPRARRRAADGVPHRLADPHCRLPRVQATVRAVAQRVGYGRTQRRPRTHLGAVRVARSRRCVWATGLGFPRNRGGLLMADGASVAGHPDATGSVRGGRCGHELRDSRCGGGLRGAALDDSIHHDHTEEHSGKGKS
jgi:hypothetical protein